MTHYELEIRSVERDICPIADSNVIGEQGKERRDRIGTNLVVFSWKELLEKFYRGAHLQ